MSPASFRFAPASRPRARRRDITSSKSLFTLAVIACVIAICATVMPLVSATPYPKGGGGGGGGRGGGGGGGGSRGGGSSSSVGKGAGSSRGGGGSSSNSGGTRDGGSSSSVGKGVGSSWGGGSSSSNSGGTRDGSSGGASGGWAPRPGAVIVTGPHGYSGYWSGPVYYHPTYGVACQFQRQDGLLETYYGTAMCSAASTANPTATWPYGATFTPTPTTTPFPTTGVRSAPSYYGTNSGMSTSTIVEIAAAGVLSVFILLCCCVGCCAAVGSKTPGASTTRPGAGEALPPMAATNDLQVTAQGSLSTPVHIALEFDNDRAEGYLRTNPPLPPLVTADQIEQMKNSSAWQFSAAGLSPSQATVGDNLISFFQGLAPFAPGQDATVFTTLPVPWLPENIATVAVGDAVAMSPRPVLYFEITVIAMSPQTTIAVGLTTTPYPSYRLPGWHTWSLGYHSDDGRLFACDSEHGQSYGMPFRAVDVVGVGIDTARRAVFFTRNGVRLPDVPPETRPIPAPELAVHPAVGADGPCIVQYNFGTTGPFKWAEANDGSYGYCWEPLPTYSATARPVGATNMAASPSVAPFFAPGSMTMPTPTMVMPTPMPIATTFPYSPPIGTSASPAGPFVIPSQAAVLSLPRPSVIPADQRMPMPEPTAASMPPTATSPPALR